MNKQRSHMIIILQTMLTFLESPEYFHFFELKFAKKKKALKIRKLFRDLRKYNNKEFNHNY